MTQRKRQKNDDPVLEKLSEILSVLQDLLIIEAARAGMSSAEVRKLIGVRNIRVSRIWKHVKKKLTE